MNVGELRRALRGVRDNMPVFVDARERCADIVGFGPGEVQLVLPARSACSKPDLNGGDVFIVDAFDHPPPPPVATTERKLRLVKS